MQVRFITCRQLTDPFKMVQGFNNWERCQQIEIPFMKKLRKN